MTKFLSLAELECRAPSAFTTNPYHKMSEQYRKIHTFDLVRGMMDLGFRPTHASETRARKKERIGYGKHMIRLRRENEREINGLYPELILINSHDGSSSYQLRAGIYRMVCENGMIVGDEMMQHRVRHQGNVLDKVVDACNEIIEVFPVAIEKADQWQKIELTPDMQLSYATQARNLKWPEDSDIGVDPQHLLKTHRKVDDSADLWTTFNVVQENLIRGGIRTQSRKTKNRQRSRPIKSVAENARINTELWNLTDSMAA